MCVFSFSCSRDSVDCATGHFGCFWPSGAVVRCRQHGGRGREPGGGVVPPIRDTVRGACVRDCRHIYDLLHAGRVLCCGHCCRGAVLHDPLVSIPDPRCPRILPVSIRGDVILLSRQPQRSAAACPLPTRGSCSRTFGTRVPIL